MESLEIKNKFLIFFEKNDHMRIKNSSIIPENDPTLLFLNSGMAAIKNYFTGESKPPKAKLCNVQSCIRTIDIDDVGDKHHLTSFDMLGSWSIGGYFKEKAISLAWDFLVNVLKIPKEKLYFSVFSGDDELNLPPDEEARAEWIKVGADENHVVSLGREDNFWGPPAETGPCGPCTEVFYDTGIGETYYDGVFDTKQRYIEIWNAGVFMMFNKNDDGSYSSLAFKSVDTGAGLERLSMVLGGYSSVYETDLMKPIKNKIKMELPNIKEREARILTDHMRTSALILSARVRPSNEGRGYIPRRLIRKCVMISEKSGGMNLTGIIDFIIENYSGIHSEFEINKRFVLEEFEREKERFYEVLKNGMELLKTQVGRTKIEAETAFEMTATHGLPFEIIKDFAYENGLFFDEKGYLALNEKHKEISRANINKGNAVPIIIEKIQSLSKTEFLGYESFECEAEIIKIFEESDKDYVVLNRTTAYAKSGGQASDMGVIFGEDFYAEIIEVIKFGEVFVHSCNIRKNYGQCKKVKVKIDEERRKALSRAHSAAHLLHSALKSVFGSGIRQQGLALEEDRVRFDFSLDRAPERGELNETEKIVNKSVIENIRCETIVVNQFEAVKSGAVALFGEKYGEKVRVVSFENVSREFCGGTHAKFSGEIGMFLITSSGSVSKGIRRISALTGVKVVEYARNCIDTLFDCAKIINVKPENFAEAFQKKLTELKSSKERAKKIEKSDFTMINGKFPLAFLESDEKISKDSADKLAEEIKGGVLTVSGVGKKDDKRIISFSLSSVIGRHAGKILSYVLKKFGGKAGGGETSASGGVVGVPIQEIAEEIIKYD
jgi:alanyl-tRNA synthetase